MLVGRLVKAEQLGLFGTIPVRPHLREGRVVVGYRRDRPNYYEHTQPVVEARAPAPLPTGAYDPATMARKMLDGAFRIVDEPESNMGAGIYHPESEQLFELYRHTRETFDYEPDFDFNSEDWQDEYLSEIVGVPMTDYSGERLSERRRTALALDTVRAAMQVRGDPRGEEEWLDDARYGVAGKHAPRAIYASRGRMPEWSALALVEDTLQAHGALRVGPVGKDEAAAFIAEHHSHQPKANFRGVMFTIGARWGDRLVAVATAGTPTGVKPPLSRHTLELTRVASDGSTPNASSMLTARVLKLTTVAQAARAEPGEPVRSRDGKVRGTVTGRTADRSGIEVQTASGTATIPLGDAELLDRPWLFVTYTELDEEGVSYRALRDLGLRPVEMTDENPPSGARARSEAPHRRRIRWEAGPAARDANWSLLERTPRS